VVQQRRRREIREIREIQDTDGTTHTSPTDIRNTFVRHLAQKFGPITVDDNTITALLHNMPQVNPSTYAEQLERPITSDEIHNALRAGDRHKAPGIDGLSLEFYTANWDTIRMDLTELINHIFLQKHIPPRLKHGIIIRLPKSQNSHTLDDFRHISLLNNDYKLLARVLARRLHPVLADQLSTTQFYGVSDNTILDALAGIRDILAHCEDKGKPICLLILDLKQALDRISHHYLVTILRQYGITNWSADRLQELYTQAQASVQVNGSLAGPIEIRSGVNQGCSISMILYSLFLHLLLCSLEKTLPGIPIGDQVYSPVIAYADDLMVFV
jgi:hypothetical protein